MTPRERLKFLIYTILTKADDAPALIAQATEELEKEDVRLRAYLAQKPQFPIQPFDYEAERVVLRVFSD